MDGPLQIIFDNLDHNLAIDTMIREQSEKLERFYHHITDARVIVSLSSKSHHTGNQYHVTIEVNVPGKRLVVSKSPGRRIRHEELLPTINDAFKAMVRRLEDYARKQRGDVKHHETPLEGRVHEIYPLDDYGTISMADGRRVNFERASVIGEGFDALHTGTPVRVVLRYDDNLEGRASTVEAISDMQYIPEPDRAGRGR